MPIKLEFEGSRIVLWKIGDMNPIYNIRNYDKLKNIVITDEELQYVYGMFSNNSILDDNDEVIYTKPEFIPKGNEIRIFGDLAKIIVSNLNYL